jgi:cell pole-organizing protein PopZ
MSKPDKAPGADMEEILASIRRIIADGEAGASTGPDFSTRATPTPELAAAEIHSPAYGADDPEDIGNLIHGWETPRGDPNEEQVLELSDEFVLADGEGAAGLARGAVRARRAGGSAPKSGPAPKASQAPGAASALKVEHDPRLERDVRPDAPFRSAVHSSVPESAGSRSGAASAESGAAPRTQPRERQPVSFWSRREPYSRQQNAQPTPVQPTAPEAARETAYGKIHPDDRVQPAAHQGGERARDRWFGGVQATPPESGSGAAPEPARAAHQESVPARDEPKPRREDAPPSSPIEEAAPRPPERRPREAAARPVTPSEQKVVMPAFVHSPQAEASETSAPARSMQSGPLEINAVENPPQATGGALAQTASHVPARPASASQTPATIGQSEVVAARSSTMVTARQDMAARQESRAFEHGSQTMQAEIMPPNGAGGRTMEDTVKEMLRPMLRQWLNENMPRIVEKVAREEILARAAANNNDDKR